MRSGDGAGHERTCEGTTLAGEPCRAFALPESRYCLSHDPERREELRASRSKGAANASRVRSLRGRRKKLDTVPALVRFTADVIQDALAGELDVAVARTVFYGISIQRYLVDAADLDARLRTVEERLSLRRIG